MDSPTGSRTGSSDLPVLGEAKRRVIPPKIDPAADGGGGRGASTGGAGGARKKKQAHGSTAVPLYGVRVVKQYPVTEWEFSLIGERRNIATILFSIGTALVGGGLGIMKDIVFTDSPKTIALPLFVQSIQSHAFDWRPISISFLIVGTLCFLGGAAFTWSGKKLIDRIKNDTKFPSDEDADV